MQNRLLRTRVVCAALVLLAACLDAPTGPGVAKVENRPVSGFELDRMYVTAPPKIGCDRGTCWDRGMDADEQGTDVTPSGGQDPATTSYPDPSASCDTSYDSNCDGDSADDGPIAFGLCMAAAMGPGGWGAVIVTGIGAWELMQTRLAVRSAHREWKEYWESSTWNSDVDHLLRMRYEDAKDTETKLWIGTGAAAGIAAWEIGRAAISCAPTSLAPL